MTAATGLKRLGIAVLAGLAALFALLGALPLLLSESRVRDAVAEEIRAVTGLDLLLGGNVRVSLFPTGSVSFADVALGDDDEQAMTAERLTARLRFLPLLTGRVEIADFKLVRPNINVTIGADGRSNWTVLIERLARALGPESQRTREQTPFSEIAMERGTLVLRDGRRGSSETLHNVQLALAWPSISKSFAATGEFTWNGQRIDTSVALSDFAAALAGRQSGLRVRLGGAPAKAVFEGSISVRPTLKVEGTFAADAPSLREALLWAGHRPIISGGLGRFALKAKTNISGGTVALTGVNLDLDGNVMEGVLTFATDGRKTLQGTLAAEELNLNPYLSNARIMTAAERNWDRMPLGLERLNGMDLDLRLSSGKISLARARIGRTAVAANLRGGKLNVTIGEAQAFGGIVKGTITLAHAGNGGDAASQLNFSDVDLESSLGDLFGFRRIEGRGNLALNIEASGTDVLSMTRTINGTATLIGNKGALVGWNIEQLLRRLERRPLSGAGDFRNGRTPFERLTVGLKIVHGTAVVEEMYMSGTKVRIGLGGTSSIPEREFDLRGVAALIAPGTADGNPGFELPFVVQGNWDDPIMLPDTQSLLMRSPAASPLLDAVKRRTTRDSVRSAIEKLTGGSIPAPETGASR